MGGRSLAKVGRKREKFENAKMVRRKNCVRESCPTERREGRGGEGALLVLRPGTCRKGPLKKYEMWRKIEEGLERINREASFEKIGGQVFDVVSGVQQSTD